MKLTDYLPEGAQGRIEADTRAAAPESKAFAFATAMVAELASKTQAQIAGLRAEIAELQRNPADQYKGVFRMDLEYQRGDTTTHKGNLWLALTTTDSEPGHGPAWKMVSKSGGPPQ